MTATNIFLGNEEVFAQYILETWEPPIRKLFLRFTEYELRPSTEMIVIHHAGFPDGDKDSSAEEIHKFHQEVNGWAGIGYHYVIRKDGTIEQGRRPQMVGAHAYKHNRNSVGICVAGNFELAKPERKQLDSLKLLTARLCQRYKLNPMKDGVIVGHRNLNDTDCPGKNLYSKLNEIRRYCRDF
ncbi:MAG: N-acetylmuramoyl-L-alanine amidase [Selenomonadaceae bacterium]|nr:N-acetylmuramoyl-L-alanine amidase [Selenomonadaceae bacterium]